MNKIHKTVQLYSVYGLAYFAFFSITAQYFASLEYQLFVLPLFFFVLLQIRIKRKEELLTNKDENIFIIDQFRQILSYLGLYNRVRRVKKPMITSSIQGEGKSYVSANLTYTLAFSGKKVALLDRDVRNRKVSTLFEFDKNKGISDYLYSQTSYESLLHSVGKNPPFGLPAGSKAINSSELLTSTNLDRLFQTLEEDFESILVDKPPINIVSDAQTLSYFCDKSLLIVRHAFTPKFVIEHLDEHVDAKGLKNCAVVFNGVKNRGVVCYNNYGYGYGYVASRAYAEVLTESLSASTT